MQCYTELIPPSAVTHAVALPFLYAGTTNLVVAKTSLLQVFDVRRSRKNGAEEESADDRNTLVLIGEYTVSGTITALDTISALNTRSGGDAVLIAFKDAKLSLVEWDPENYKISTVSIHYYEGENITIQPFGASLAESESILTVDPRSRCAALKFGARHLAILPFRQTGDELMEGADEGLDAEMDVAPASNTLKRTQSGLNDASDASAKETPYKSSFVLPLTALDPILTHPVDIAFLHEYREPTFGILSAMVQPSTSLLETRKDILSYTVFTLDLEQRASTNLISATKLPSDLWKVVPLPLPVGGALLIGTNEFLHVDQSGKTNAVAVNEFAKEASNFGMTDQSDLNMKLEGCRLETLDSATGVLLIVLNDGCLAVLSFRLLGRNVNGLKVTPVTSGHGGRILKSAASCVAALYDDKVFVGSEDGDASLIRWTKSASMLSRKRSHAQMLGQEALAEEEEDAEDLDDDDLYASTAEPVRRTSSSAGATSYDAAAAFTFEVLDTLPSLGPLSSICLGRSSASLKGQLEMLAGIGRQESSRLASMSKEVRPRRLNTAEFENAKNVWSVSILGQDAVPEEENYDSLLFCYDGENTKIFDISHDPETSTAVYAERDGNEFEREDETLEIATLANGTRIVQVKLTEIKTYIASDLSFEQAIPMLVEETDAELKIVHTSICDPYLLAIREDSTVCVVRTDENGEVEALENTIELNNRKWLSGCLYSGHPFAGECELFLLGEDGDLHIFDLPTLEHIQSMPMLPFLPTVLSQDLPLRRGGAKETLTELLVAELGTEDLGQPYLILRNAMDDLTLYEPYFTDQENSLKNVHFRKVPFSYLPKFDDTAMDVDDNRPAPLKEIRLGRYRAVHVPGTIPTIILKEHCSLPKAFKIPGGTVNAFTPLNHRSCEHGFGVIENDHLVEYNLSTSLEFSSGWCVERTKIGEPAEEVRHVAFHDSKKMYVVATCKMVDFYFPEEDGRHQEQGDISLRPQVPQYTLYLISANTRQTIHSFEMPYLDTVTSLKIMPLEVSEQTHEQKGMVVVGTSAQRGEDMPAKGAVNVFEVLDVVPEPDAPESGYKLHLISREETKGAVTTVESFSGGFVGTGQGQKLMIRGLKEDGSCLPIAFLDAQCHTVSLKMLGSSGMWLAADAWKGIWFGGFTQEPYKLTVLGKSRTKMEVVAAEFLPYDQQLYICIVDAQMDLHVLQYDPENPKTMNGTRLLHRSTFHLGHFPTSMTLVPSTLAPIAEQPVVNGNGAAPDMSPQAPSLSHVLTTSLSGAVGLLTPFDETTYRRLGSLQTHLTSILEHTAGLNPRAYRSVESEGFGARGVVDGSLVSRIWELGSARRAETLARAGADGFMLRSDLEIIGGGGLGYL